MLAYGGRKIAIQEIRNKVLRGPAALQVRRFENAEVGRLAGGRPRLPAARVATIIPSYRRPVLLQRAVRSALAQTLTDQVVLVVDDGGGLPDLPADPRLHAVSLSANSGVPGAVRNVGIRLSLSEYVAFLDDDNEWEPHHLETAVRAFWEPHHLETAVRAFCRPAGQPGPGHAGPGGPRPGQPGPGLVYTAVRRSRPGGECLDVLSVPFDRRLLARRSFVDTSALVVRRFPGLRFSRIPRRRGVRPKEDWELVYRLSRSVPAVHLAEPTVRYLVNPDSYFTDWAPPARAQPGRR